MVSPPAGDGEEREPGGAAPAAAAPAAPCSAPNIAGLRPRPAPRPFFPPSELEVGPPPESTRPSACRLGGTTPCRKHLEFPASATSGALLGLAAAPAECAAARSRRSASKAPCRLGLTGTPRERGRGAGPVEPRPKRPCRNVAASRPRVLARAGVPPRLINRIRQRVLGGPSSETDPLRIPTPRTGGAHQAASQRASSANGHQFPMTEVIGGNLRQ